MGNLLRDWCKVDKEETYEDGARRTLALMRHMGIEGFGQLSDADIDEMLKNWDCPYKHEKYDETVRRLGLNSSERQSND